MKKRPIDVVRDAAIRMELVGNNTGEGRDLYALGDRLLSIHARGVFEIQLPDEIDPGRTNADIEPTYQQVLAAGAEDQDVIRTLLQARRLLRDALMPQHVNVVRAQKIVFEGLHDLVAMREVSKEVTEQINGAIGRFKTAKGKRGLPSLPNLKPQCEMFMQKAKHITASMRDFASLFYPDAAKKRDWPLEVAASAIAAVEGVADATKENWSSWAEFLSFVADARNAMEHRDDSKRFIVKPFILTPENVVVPPVIEVVHPRRPNPPMSAELFLTQVTDLLRDSYEGLIVGLADVHAVRFAGLETRVGFVPEDARGNRPERYAFYGLKPDGQWAIYL